jgi:diguanylate cyclase (GGDEF)-like protein
MNDTLKLWWRQPDHFDWLSAYIADHGLQPISRCVIGGSAAVLALTAGVLTLSPAGPRGVAADTVSVVVSVVGMTLAGGWLVRWPTRRGSALFALAAIACFATVCLVQTDPIIGLMGCSAFATIGGYIALFHTPRFMACYLTVATATTAVLAVRVAAGHDVVLGATFAAMIGAVNLSVSFVVHMLMNFLRVDVLESERDPLTSLLNRRGFDRAARTLLATPHRDEAHLIVAMVDLDRFKVLNDDLGHAAGDRVLTAVADVLRAHTGAAAVIGRVGGEEFLVAEVAGAPDPAAMADVPRDRRHSISDHRQHRHLDRGAAHPWRQHAAAGPHHADRHGRQRDVRSETPRRKSNSALRWVGRPAHPIRPGRRSAAALSGRGRPGLSQVAREFVSQRLRRTSHRGIVSPSSPER